MTYALQEALGHKPLIGLNEKSGQVEIFLELDETDETVSFVPAPSEESLLRHLLVHNKLSVGIDHSGLWLAKNMYNLNDEPEFMHADTTPENALAKTLIESKRGNKVIVPSVLHGRGLLAQTHFQRESSHKTVVQKKSEQTGEPHHFFYEADDTGDVPALVKCPQGVAFIASPDSNYPSDEFFGLRSEEVAVVFSNLLVINSGEVAQNLQERFPSLKSTFVTQDDWGVLFAELKQAGYDALEIGEPDEEDVLGYALITNKLGLPRTTVFGKGRILPVISGNKEYSKDYVNTIRVATDPSADATRSNERLASRGLSL